MCPSKIVPRDARAFITAAGIPLRQFDFLTYGTKKICAESKAWPAGKWSIGVGPHSASCEMGHR